jgi:hypothetical protein
LLYEEIAMAMTYYFGDSNQNGVHHEMALYLEGDVPDFFTFTAFKEQAADQYKAVGGSPHNSIWGDHAAAVDLGLFEGYADKYLAFLDARPMVADVIDRIRKRPEYRHLVVVPLFLAQSTHTHEVEEQVRHWVEVAGGSLTVTVGQSFLGHDYVRERHTAFFLFCLNVGRQN